jgi:predicted DNA-binding protein (UPF0251 family)
MSDQTYFTRKEAAAEVRVSEETIKRAINSGRLLKAWFDALVDA